MSIVKDFIEKVDTLIDKVDEEYDSDETEQKLDKIITILSEDEQDTPEPDESFVEYLGKYPDTPEEQPDEQDESSEPEVEESNQEVESLMKSINEVIEDAKEEKENDEEQSEYIQFLQKSLQDLHEPTAEQNTDLAPGLETAEGAGNVGNSKSMDDEVSESVSDAVSENLKDVFSNILEKIGGIFGKITSVLGFLKKNKDELPMYIALILFGIHEIIRAFKNWIKSGFGLLDPNQSAGQNTQRIMMTSNPTMAIGFAGAETLIRSRGDGTDTEAQPSYDTVGATNRAFESSEQVSDKSHNTIISNLEKTNNIEQTYSSDSSTTIADSTPNRTEPINTSNETKQSVINKTDVHVNTSIVYSIKDDDIG